MRHVLLSGFIIVVLLGARSSYACLPEGVLYFEVSPPCPVEADSVKIAVFGGFPNQCWSPTSLDSAIVNDSMISMHLSTVHSGYDICFMQPVAVYHAIETDPRPAGTYAIEVVVSIDTGKYAGTYICISDFSVYAMGDANADHILTAADVIVMVNHVFRGDVAPCGRMGDVNCDHTLTSADIIYLVNHLFKSGPPPVIVCEP